MADQPSPPTRRRLLASLAGFGMSGLLAACGVETLDDTGATPTAAALAQGAATNASAAPATPAWAGAKPAASAATATPLAVAAPPPAMTANATPSPTATLFAVPTATPRPTITPTPAPPVVTMLVRAVAIENQGQQQVFEPALRARLPEVRVERVTASGDYAAAVNRMAAAGQGLDLWGFGGAYVAYWANGLAEPIETYAVADKWDVNAYFVAGMTDAFRIRGKLYGLPQQTTYGSNVVYNRRLFDAAGLPHPPTDWNDTTWNFTSLLTVATRLSRNVGTPDAQFGVYWLLNDRMVSIPYLFGADPFLLEHYTNFIAPRTSFAQPGAVEGHQVRHDFIYKYRIHPDPAAERTLLAGNDPFRTGRVAMLLDGGWQFWTTSSVSEFPFGFAALPIARTNKNLDFDDFWIMGRGSAHKDATWKVLRVLTSVDVATQYALLTDAPPAPRAATDVWLQRLAGRTGQSVDALRQLTQGAIDRRRSQESPDHLFLEYATIAAAYSAGIAPLWNDRETSAVALWPSLTAKMDAAVQGIYARYQGTLPKG